MKCKSLEAICKTNVFDIPGFSDASFLATFSDSAVTPSDPLVFDFNLLNPGGHYDNSTGIYTVPVTGTYQIIIYIWGNNDPEIRTYLNVDGTRVSLSLSLQEL